MSPEPLIFRVLTRQVSSGVGLQDGWETRKVIGTVPETGAEDSNKLVAARPHLGPFGVCSPSDTRR